MGESPGGRERVCIRFLKLNKVEYRVTVIGVVVRVIVNPM